MTHIFRKNTVKLRVLMRVTNSNIKLWPKGQSIQVPKPLHKQSKKPGCGSKQYVLELVTIR